MPRGQLADFPRRALGENASAVKHDRPVAPLGFIQIRRAHQHGQPLVVNEIQNDPPQVAPRDRIDTHGRLVQQQQLRRADQRAGEAQLLLHAARKLARQPIGERTERGHVHQLRKFFLSLVRGHTVQIGIQIHVFLDRQIFVQPEALRHVADSFLHLLRIGRDVDSQHAQFAGIGGEQPGGQPDQRCFAGAVRADERRQRAVFGSERNAVESLNCLAAAARECFADVLPMQDRSVNRRGIHRAAPTARAKDPPS